MFCVFGKAGLEIYALDHVHRGGVVHSPDLRSTFPGCRHHNYFALAVCWQLPNLIFVTHFLLCAMCILAIVRTEELVVRCLEAC